MSRRDIEEFDSRTAPKFVIRFKRQGMPEEVAERSRLESRSQNDVWLVAMEEYLHRKRRKHLLLDALESKADELGIKVEDLM